MKQLFHRVMQVARAQWLAILFALLVGLLSVAPHILARVQLGTSYQGIPFMYLDDEDIYLARMHEILDGHWMVGSPYFHEYKDSVSMLPPLGEAYYAVPSMLFQIPLTEIVVFSKFLLPLILFLLAYVLALRLMDVGRPENRKLTACAAAVMIVIGYSTIPFSELAHWVRTGSIAQNLPLWTRLVNPVTGAILLFSYFLVVWELWNGRRRRHAWVAGVLWALMASYFFSWAFALSVSAFFLLFALITKQKAQMRSMILMLGIGAVCVIPLWWGMIQRIGAPGGQALSVKNGMSFTHAPLLNKTLLAAIAIFFILTWIAARGRKGLKEIMRRPWWLFCLAFLFGGIWSLSQQIVTGRTIWPHHFVQYTVPFAILTLFVAAWYACSERFPRIWKAVCIAAIAFIVLESAGILAGVRSKLDDFRMLQTYAPAFAWLDAHAPPSCVVLVDEPGERITRLVPAFSHCDVYLSSYIYFGVPDDRVLHNFLLMLRFHGVTPDTVRAYLNAHEDLVREYFFESFETLFARSDDAWVQGKIDGLVAAYPDFYAGDLASEIHTYQADYVMSPTPLSSELQQQMGVRRDLGQIGSLYLYAY